MKESVKGTGFTHFDGKGNAVMVDVSAKEVTVRQATARGRIRMKREVLEAVRRGQMKKGDVLGVARIAGIMGVKRTAELIPLCHSLPVEKCQVDFEIREDEDCIDAVCTVGTCARTGVEMEALTGVTAALLTIYDMCKAMDRSMEITDIRLMEKSGGASGLFIREEEKG